MTELRCCQSAMQHELHYKMKKEVIQKQKMYSRKGESENGATERAK